MEKINYFLVLEKRLGDYNIIDINKLDICEIFVNNDIASIDAFTCKYKESELKDAIIRSNMAVEEYIGGTLKIVSDVKHNLSIITKEMFLDICAFQHNLDEIDKELKNKLYGVYKKVVESTFEDKGFIAGLLLRFNNTLKENDKRAIFKIIEELPYTKSRNIYLSISKEFQKRKQENLRKLEKLNDMA